MLDTFEECEDKEAFLAMFEMHRSMRHAQVVLVTEALGGKEPVIWPSTLHSPVSTLLARPVCSNWD
jgi:hypothetical protein